MLAAPAGSRQGFTDASLPGLVFVAVAGVVVLVRILITGRADRELLGIRDALAPRALLMTVVGVQLARHESGVELVAALVGTAVLVGAVTVEPILNRIENFRVPVVAHLPGVESRTPGGPVGRWAVWATLGGVLLGILMALVDLNSGWWFAVAVLAIVPYLIGLARGRLRVLETRRLRRVVPEAVAAYGPQFVVYTSRPDDASHQVAMWLPYLQRSGYRFMIVTRNGVPAQALADRTDVPVIEARRISDLDALLVPSLRAAFYVNASSGNGAFVRYPQLTHIYLGHGDSDKPPSYNPTHAMYDQIFAAGPAATRRYADHGVRIAAEKFAVVGRPQVEDVQQVDRAISSVQHPVVLYAPTWRGHVEETLLYSLPDGERIVESLLARGCTVIFRPHPFSYGHPPDAEVILAIQHRLADDRRATGREHLWGPVAESSMSIMDCINASDALVSDVSSVVSDYLFSQKPFAMIAVPSEPEQFVRDYPVARAAYVVRGDLADLEPQLDRLFGEDTMAGQRAAVRIDNLGDFPASTYADAFVEAVRAVASHESGHDAGTEDDFAEGAGGEQERSEQGAGSGQDAEAETEGESRADGGPETSVSGARRRRLSVLGRYRQVLERTALDLGSSLLAVLGLGLVVVGAPIWSAALVAAVALLVSAWGARNRIRKRANWSTMLGRSDVSRTVVAVTLAVGAVESGAQPGVVAAAAGLFALGVVAESHILSGWGRVGLQVHDFPTVQADVAEVVPRGVVPLASFGALVLSCLLLAAGAPAWLTLALAAVVFVLSADATVRALIRARRVITAEQRFVAALTDYGPQFAVYFASTVGAAYQIGMWLPYFVRIGRPFVIITRTLPMLREVAALTAGQGVVVPIIHRSSLRSVEEILVPSMTTAFYVNNAVRNTHLVERRELTQVWLNHGDSEKPACYNPVHAIYDLLFAAGQAGIDRYARHGVNIPLEKFRIVGRPQVEAILPAATSIEAVEEPTVLYAPTWQGPFSDTRVSSLAVGYQIVEALLARGVRVIFRSHPFNYRFPAAREQIAAIGRLLATDRRATGRAHLWGPAAERDFSVEDCFNASDAMISDVSAVVSDYLKANKPFAMVAVGRSAEQLLELAPAARAAYVINESLDNLPEVLEELLATDPAAAARAATRTYYLGDFADADYAEGFLGAARSVIDREQAYAWMPDQPASSARTASS